MEGRLITDGPDKGLVEYLDITQQGYSNARLAHEVRRQLNMREKTGHVKIINPDPKSFQKKIYADLNGRKVLLLREDPWGRYAIRHKVLLLTKT